LQNPVERSWKRKIYTARWKWFFKRFDLLKDYGWHR
jgi:hypothetical protein